jgi:hypothetical protein
MMAAGTFRSACLIHGSHWIALANGVLVFLALAAIQAMGVAGTRNYFHVVPAKAGTHNHRS